MAGMVAQQIWISVVGFLVMLGCAVLAITGWRKAPKPGEQQASAEQGRRKSHQHRSMMSRIEERWQRRRDEQGGQGGH
jgi:hypothetical protein